MRRATRHEQTKPSQVGHVPNAHAPLKPKMTSQFRRDPAVPSGLQPRPDLVEGVGSLREHLSLHQRKKTESTFSHFPWKI